MKCRGTGSLADRFSSFLDRLLGGSWRGQFLALFLFSLAILTAGSLLLLAAGVTHRLFPAVWWTFVRVTDTGYMGQDEPGLPRAISVFVTLSGWVIFGLLISIVSAMLQERLTALRQGRTRFHAANHSLVLGWNSNVFAVLDELACTDDAPAAPIVLLSDRAAETVAAEIRKSCRRETSRRVHCRTGRTDSPHDLARVNAAWAREILVLHTEQAGDGLLSDAAALRTLLALHGYAAAASETVAEFHCPLALELVDGLYGQGAHVSPVISADVLGRILAQCALQPGLARVFEDIFAYGRTPGESNEIYLIDLDRAGLDQPRPYEDLVYCFAPAVPLGYQRRGAEIVLNPSYGSDHARAALGPGDRLVVLAAAPSRAVYHPRPCPDRETPPAIRLSPPPVTVLVAGAGRKASVAARELAALLPAGSTIACTARQVAASLSGAPPLHTVEIWEAVTLEEFINVVHGPCLERLAAIILAEERPTRVEHDDCALMALAAVRAAGGSGKVPRVVVELLDARNLELARAAEARDVIVSPEILSDYLVQLVRQPERGRIYAELLSARGAELYIKPAACYLHPGEEPDFALLAARARRRGETAVGCFRGQPGRGGEPILCPAPGERVAREELGGVIVLAEGND